MKTIVSIALGCAAAAAALPGTAPAQEKKLTPVSYTLNWYPQAEHGGLYHAKAAGLFEKHGLDVTCGPPGRSVTSSP